MQDYDIPRCEVCGAEEPIFHVYDVMGQCLGCEVCLTIYEDGRVRI